MASQKTNIAALDFDEIKNSLKEYLRSQTQFADYNFEGSSLNILLDILAYNTHYGAYYTNMVSNECHLDSAITRNAVISEANKLGYTPRSYRAATAIVDLVITPPAGETATTYTLNKYSLFSAVKDNITYNFYTTESMVATKASGLYTFNDVEIKEGQVTSTTYEVNTSDESQRFIIPNSKIDTSTLVVKIQKSSSDTETTIYTFTNSILGIDGDSMVYFLQESHDNQFEIYFGDGITGKALEDGNIVIMEYIITNGEDANDIGYLDSASNRTFVTNVLSGYSSVVSVAVDDDGEISGMASGGAVNESIKSIKFNAPRYYQAQNRAVTTRDYKVILQSQFSNIESINVWGGEDNTPPDYGKVFISIKPATGYYVTTSYKQDILDFLSEYKNIVSVIPVFLDPEYVYITINSTVTYNTSTLIGDGETIKNLVKNAIYNFGSENITDFGSIFRFSNLSEDIDNAHESIISNLTTIKLRKEFTPSLIKSDNYTIEFGNSFQHNDIDTNIILESSVFTYTHSDGSDYECYFDDDGNGNVRIYNNISESISGELVSSRNYLNSTAGTIDYDTGIITLSNFLPKSVTDSIISLIVEPNINDISVSANNLMFIDNADIVVSAVGV